MLRSSFIALSVTATLAACGSKGGSSPDTVPDDLDVAGEGGGEGEGEGDGAGGDSADEPAPPPPEVHDQAVEEGGAWKRIEPGTWEMTAFKSETSTRSLSAQVGGRAVLLVELPEGATGGTLSRVSGHYTHAGTARWVVYPAAGKDGDLSGDPLGETELVIAAAQVAKVGGEAIWTDATFAPAIAIDATRFHLSLEVVDDQPAVAADADNSKKVFYQGPKDKKPKKVPMSAHVKVVLTDVR